MATSLQSDWNYFAVFTFTFTSDLSRQHTTLVAHERVNSLTIAPDVQQITAHCVSLINISTVAARRVSSTVQAAAETQRATLQTLARAVNRCDKAIGRYNAWHQIEMRSPHQRQMVPRVAIQDPKSIRLYLIVFTIVSTFLSFHSITQRLKIIFQKFK